MVAHERVDIAVLFRLPLHELQRADRRRATVDIVAEKDEQIVRVVKRNPCQIGRASCRERVLCSV